MRAVPQQACRHRGTFSNLEVADVSTDLRTHEEADQAASRFRRRACRVSPAPHMQARLLAQVEPVVVLGLATLQLNVFCNHLVRHVVTLQGGLVLRTRSAYRLVNE